MTRLTGFVALLFLMATPAFAQEVTGSRDVTAQYRDPQTIERITNRLAGRARESWNTVLADGEPPLTWGSVATFSLLIHECFDAQLTEAEAELMAKKFAESYENSDAIGRKELTSGWTQMLETATSGSAARAQVRTKLQARIQSAAAAKTGWGVAAQEALDRRNRPLHKSLQPRPAWVGANFDASMSIADLDASMELLYFMWVAAGRNPQLVTLETVAAIRNHFAQHFDELPADLQYVLANGASTESGSAFGDFPSMSQPLCPV